MNKVLNFGMVGGGIGSLIGEVHRKSASFDRKAKLVAGCFSRSYDNTLSTGKKLGLDSGRLYKNFKEMAEKEGAREDKIDFVIIVTPNNSHFEIAKAFLEKGINVVCDKPLALRVSRLPGGHPEGVYEAFANIYSNFSDALLAKKAGSPYQNQREVDFPTFEDGTRGVKFINLCVESSQRGACWISTR